MKFTMSGQLFEFDPAPEQIMGDELLEIEEHSGQSVAEWGRRLATKDLNLRDLLLLAYLAARRQDPTVAWAPFIRTIAPLTFQVVEDEPAAEPQVPAAA